MIEYITRFFDWAYGSCEDGEVQEKALSYEPIWISRPLAEQTQTILRSFCGEVDREGVVYWTGVQIGRGGVVTTLFIPDAEAGPGYVKTTPLENAEIITELDNLDLVLLGQAHSHPPGAGTTHSRGDDEKTFSPFEGAVSVVAADYGQGSVPESWGIHRFMDGEYHRISGGGSRRHLRVVPGKRDRRTPNRMVNAGE